jgi:outer membrane protein TolC
MDTIGLGNRNIVRLVPLLLAVSGILPAMGCSSAYQTNRANQEVEAILGPAVPRFNRERRLSVKEPETTAPADTPRMPGSPEEADSDRSGAGREQETLTLTLLDTLENALATNRQQISRKESLYLTALGLAGTRHSFTPQLSAVCNYLFSDGTGRASGHSAGLGFSASQILPSGGTLSFNADTAFAQDNTAGLADPRTYSSSLGLNLSRPLLRGAGREIAFESLLQAERNLIYAIRDFELFRQEFSIDVANRYYDLVRQKKTIENRHQNKEKLDYAHRKAKAFNNVGKSTEIEVLRARQDALDAENELIIAEQDYELALDNFRIFLGFPAGARVEVTPDEPVFIPVDYDVDSAVEVAIANRLDHLTRREQLEDAERGLRITENSLLPDLGLNLGYSLSSDPIPGFGSQKLDNGSLSAGLSLEIPIDRVSERHSFRRAQISYAAQKRSFDESRDQLIVGVASSLRELKRQKRTLDIQQQQIEDAERSVRIAELRLDRGEIDNRDLLESRQNELDARNRLIDEKVNYEITRLRLLKNLGILFIDERGMWTE